MEDGRPEDRNKEKKEAAKKVVRGAMQMIGGFVPIPAVSGFLSAAASAWSENDQERVNSFFKHWLQMLADEMREKEKTIVEIIARLDLHDEEIAKRLESSEYQSLLKKTFREWSAAESEEKRKFIRNILANAAATKIVSDDIVRLFLDWLKTYSSFHFQVIGAIYNQNGITRGGVWDRLGKQPVQENSADADLFKLLFRDLSTGGIIRQHKETDGMGNFIVKTDRRTKSDYSNKIAKSAFDETEPYELTQLGIQFVHYAMTDLPVRIAAPNDGDFS